MNPHTTQPADPPPTTPRPAASPCGHGHRTATLESETTAHHHLPIQTRIYRVVAVVIVGSATMLGLLTYAVVQTTPTTHPATSTSTATTSRPAPNPTPAAASQLPDQPATDYLTAGCRATPAPPSQHHQPDPHDRELNRPTTADPDGPTSLAGLP